MVVKAAFGDEYIYDATLGTTWQQQVVAFAVKNGVTTNFTNYDTPATRGFIFEAGASAKKLVSQEQPSDMEDIMCQLLGICPEDTTDSGTGSVTPPVVVGS
ncbi:MAG: hypothetical protein LBQ59_04870 [Candidatus Peribacteria bacterium]|jgi:hypothetical protein|nr:hypothetical protein [Candidatus Peribacteria bacterium]